jgi:hypothetical protein
MIATNDSISIAHVGFVIDHLRRRARRDQRVEARHRAARDRDEEKREQVARPDGAGAVDELRERRHLQLGRNDQNADRKAENRADLEERREIVARREQEPHRQHRRDEAVADQDPGELRAGEREHRRERRGFADVLAVHDREHQAEEADDRHLADLARTDVARVHAHEDRDRYRRGDGERAPRRAGQRLHDDQREHRENDHHDEERAEQRDHAGHEAELHLDQVAQRTAVAARRDEKHDEVLHRAREHDARENPQHAGRVAHLRGEHRADERPRACDRSEVVPEQHVLVGRHVVEAVVVPHGRGHAQPVELQHLAGDKA